MKMNESWLFKLIIVHVFTAKNILGRLNAAKAP